jgi:predicted ATPase
LLLVLDACEHVIEIAATMAEAALGAGSELRILATSRELLKAEGEWVYPVSPLAVPTADVEQGGYSNTERFGCSWSAQGPPIHVLRPINPPPS